MFRNFVFGQKVLSRCKKFNPIMTRRFFATDSRTRSSEYASLSSKDLEKFYDILGETPEGQSGTYVVTGRDPCKQYNTDWMGKFSGTGELTLLPRTVDEVRAILQYCNKRKLAVVPQGGNTGLVGGSVPVFDEVVLNLRRMNNILSFDAEAGVVMVEAGVVLEDLNTYLEERGYIMKLDLGAKGSCTLGGNVSTNAGGLRLVRYGSLRGTVLGVEAVLADGRVMGEKLNVNRKDNTGYDLKQLMIGGEGTLGVVTKASFLVAPKPNSVQVAFVAVKSYDSVLRLLSAARTQLNEILSAVEFIDSHAFELVLENIPAARPPFNTERYPFYMVLETHGSNAEHDMDKLNHLLEVEMESGLILNGVVAQDAEQAKALWMLRESIAPALQNKGFVYKYDISLPVQQMYEFVVWLREKLSQHPETLACVGYGHVGDGNLHVNIVSKAFDASLFGLIEPELFERTAAVGGSISAEHGVGQCKNDYLHLAKSPVEIEIMRGIKAMFDPNNILNPYKVLPQTQTQTTK